jgi:hypothetical protein
VVVWDLDLDLADRGSWRRWNGRQLKTFSPAQNGTDGLGGGGGGKDNGGGSGGDGVLIIRRVTADSDTASGGTETTDGSDTIHTFTTSGTYVG